MKKRNISGTNKTDRVRRERDPIPWRYCILTLFCGLLLVAGFFFAARQHFSVMDYAIKNAKLRREKEGLEAEQRRLYLTKEISLSPAEIKKSAKKFGLQDLTAQSIQIMMPKKKVEEKSAPASESVPVKTFLSRNQTEKTDNSAKVSENKTADKSRDLKENKPKSKDSTSVSVSRSQIAKK